MHPFSENPTCHICDTRFAVFRRACHCRNCGVCVCRRECTVQWPSKMIPETYNHKKEAFVNICKTCDWLCHSFRLALLEGDFDKVVALHSTGNVNVNSPFGNVKGELFYPVHCAVLGGNLLLLKWLVDEHCCPIKSVRVSGKTSVTSGTYIPIVTSKGRSLLGIAMETCNVPIMRYLVVDKGTSVAGEKDITTSMLTESLTAVLYRLPADVVDAASPSARPIHNGASAPFDEDGSALSPLPPSSGRAISEGIREISDTFLHGQDSSDHENECKNTRTKCAPLFCDSWTDIRLVSLSS
jgi:FYVE zinc finger